jgi:hypothetical protein
MKKSQLRKIIRESIKGLMVEQGGTSIQIPFTPSSLHFQYHGNWVTGPGQCAGKIYLGTEGWIAQNAPGVSGNPNCTMAGGNMSQYQFIANEYGHMANFKDYVSTNWLAGGQGNKCFFNEMLHLYSWPFWQGSSQGSYSNPIMSFPNFNSVKVYTLYLGGQPNDPNSLCDLQSELGDLGYLLVHDEGQNWSTGGYCPGPCEAIAIGVYGCMDPDSSNYDASATSDDGSCEYYRCGHCDTPCTQFVVQNNPGLCSYGNPADCHQGCDTQTADLERWTCMGPDKFGNPQGCKQCNQYEINNAAGWPDPTCQHPTKNACLNHIDTINGTGTCGGPKPLDKDKDKTIQPFAPDLYSKKSDPQIDRMQDLANIKKER